MPYREGWYAEQALAALEDASCSNTPGKSMEYFIGRANVFATLELANSTLLAGNEKYNWVTLPENKDIRVHRVQ